MKKSVVCAASVLAVVGAARAADAPVAPPDFVSQFKEGDTNHDGKLTYDEYKAARLMRDGGKADETRVRHYAERFADLDVNHDKSLTVEEYKGRIARDKYQPAKKATK